MTAVAASMEVVAAVHVADVGTVGPDVNIAVVLERARCKE